MCLREKGSHSGVLIMGKKLEKCFVGLSLQRGIRGELICSGK